MAEESIRHKHCIKEFTDIPAFLYCLRRADDYIRAIDIVRDSENTPRQGKWFNFCIGFFDHPEYVVSCLIEEGMTPWDDPP